MKKTKIVCTIGPTSFDPKILSEMIASGMDVVRLNFSHGSNDVKKEQISLIRQLSDKHQKPLAIVADLSGPKIRLGKFDGVVQITKNQMIDLSPETSEDDLEQNNLLPMQFDLSSFVSKDQRIFLNDGLVELKVLSIKGKVIHTQAQNNGWVSAHKGVNIPDTNLKGASFTPKDAQDAEFAIKEGVDYLALSFVQTPEDLDPAREIIKKLKAKTKIIVKIEKKEAVDNLEEIIKKAHVVMVARGDLGIEIPAFDVPIVQQKIIKIARQNKKPVIVATQMLESMIENPRPTRAETSDVANAVLNQVDAVMLSAESASGKYPIEAVRTMSNIIEAVESNLDFKHYIKINWEEISEEDLHFNAIAASAASLAYRVNSPKIIVATATGKSALLISSFRPDTNIIAATHDERTQRQLNLFWGVTPIVVEPVEDSDQFWQEVLDMAKKHHLIQKGERVVMVGGTIVGVSSATDTIKLVKV